MIKEKKIALIVVDSRLMADGMIPMLSGTENMQLVTQTGSYKEAIALADGISPDMVFSDIHLPDKTGSELLHEIKEKYQQVIVFMITHSGGDVHRGFDQREEAN